MDMEFINGQMGKSVKEIGLIINYMGMPILKMGIKNIILLLDLVKLLLLVKLMKVKL